MDDDAFAFAEAIEDLVFGGAGDAGFDRAAMNGVAFEDVDDTRFWFGAHRAARDDEGAGAFADADEDVDVGVGQQFEFGVIDGDDHFADAACAARDDGFGDDFGLALPEAAGLRIPCDFDILIFGEHAEFGFIYEGADADAGEIGDFGEKIAGSSGPASQGFSWNPVRLPKTAIKR